MPPATSGNRGRQRLARQVNADAPLVLVLDVSVEKPGQGDTSDIA
jgi:hypothetical protein